MVNFLNPQSNFRLASLEKIGLETEDFDQANRLSNRLSEESEKWQVYLNLLGILALEEWLKERVKNQTIKLNISPEKEEFIVNINQFTITCIVTENILSETVELAESKLNHPTHFYVILEVLEEEAEAIIRGCLRYDELIDYLNNNPVELTADNTYNIPLAVFDTEPNHLLFYTQHLEPSAIALPVTEAPIHPLEESRAKLSQWLRGVLEETWITIDNLIDADSGLAFATRNKDNRVKNGKIINLGIQFDHQEIALIVTVTPEIEQKVGVLIQLFPTYDQSYLPTDITLKLLSKKGRILQEVVSRHQDNYIQLKPFQGEIGKQFSIELLWGNEAIQEKFEL